MRCNSETREHHHVLYCQRPAVVVIDRREQGTLRLCRVHATQRIWRAAKARGWAVTFTGAAA